MMTGEGVAGYVRAGLLLAREAATQEIPSNNRDSIVSKPNQYCSQAQNLLD